MPKHTHFPPKVASGPRPAVASRSLQSENDDPIVLTRAATKRTNHAHVPMTSVAAEQLANIKAWIAGVGLVTVTSVRAIDREAGNRYRPFRHLITIVQYRTHIGAEKKWSISTFGLPADVDGVRLEWWHWRAFLAHLLERKFSCTRCQGQATTMNGYRSIDLRYSATCNRCWGRRCDPTVLELITSGGDPSTRTFVVMD